MFGFFSKFFAAYGNRIALFRGRAYAKKGRNAAAHLMLVRAARGGHTEAAYQVGRNYLAGIGCVQNGSEAFRWFQIAASGGHKDAQFELGVALLNDHDAKWSTGISSHWVTESIKRGSQAAELIFPAGLSFSKNNEEAFNLLLQAAHSGRVEAQANIGWLYLKGIGCSQSYDDAHRWLTMASEHSVGQAAFGLAELYGDENYPSRNLPLRRQWLGNAAALGNASAAYQLAIESRSSNKTNFDTEEFARNISLAADAGHREAMFEYGSHLINLSRSDLELEKGIEYIRAAAKAHHIPASIALGSIFSNGKFIEPDLREAAVWLRKAADSGSAYAQFQIGCMFARGDGVPRDLIHAAHYFESSAKGGHAIGALNAAIFYERGDGVSVDIAKSQTWLIAAARAGVAQAQSRLAQLLYSKEIIPEHRATVFEFFRSNSSNVNVDAKVVAARSLIGSGEASNLVIAEQLLGETIDAGSSTGAGVVLFSLYPIEFANDIVQKALNLLHKQVHAGSSAAMIVLSEEMRRGRSGSPDINLAFELLRKAALLGEAEASFQLGVLHCQRNNDQNDLARGLSYYVEAAERGHPIAQYNAGLMLLNGVGSVIDRETALKWLDLAAARGVERASALLVQLNVDEADNISAEFDKGKGAAEEETALF